MRVHGICGSISFIINLIYGLGAIYSMGWRVTETIHGILGTSLSILMFVSGIIGYITNFFFRNHRWNGSLLVKLASIHKVSKMYEI